MNRIHLVFSTIIYGILTVFSQTQFSERFTTNTNDVELMPVTIHGGGVKAGTYYVAPALHIFDIIKIASTNGEPDLRTLDCRSVKVRTDGKAYSIDLLKYLGLGDLSQNPFITSGMDIQLDYATSFAQVQGEIQGYCIGRVPIRKNETIGELLSLYTFSSAADSENIILSRENDEMKQYTFKEISSIYVMDRDFISILPKKDMPVHTSVIVSGEASRPGTYPIIHEKTVLSEIIEKAGGASPRGDLSRAYLMRKKKTQNQTQNSFLDGQNNVRPEVTGGFKYLTASQDYTIIPLSNAVTVLEDGDEIVIPATEMCVYVSGCVKMPGAYKFSEKKGLRYYIDLAGGYAKSADRPNVKVVTPCVNNAYSISMPNHMAPGDIIMVPEAQEDKWIKKWSPVISAVATVISSAGIIVGMMNVAGK
jgi:protein involved in polysaccharide export with SLBB domain